MIYIVKLELDFSFFEEYNYISKEDLLCIIVQNIKDTDSVFKYINEECILLDPSYDSRFTMYLNLENNIVTNYIVSLINEVRCILLEHNLYNEYLMVHNVLSDNSLVLKPKNIILNELNQELENAYRYEYRDRDR